MKLSAYLRNEYQKHYTFYEDSGNHKISAMEENKTNEML